MTHPTNKPVGQDTQGALLPGVKPVRPVLNAVRRQRSKPLSPNHQSVLIHKSLFKRLQVVQDGLPHPRHLSVGDLADACIALTLEANSGAQVVARAARLLAESLIQPPSKEMK
jgi:hypothetical protein